MLKRWTGEYPLLYRCLVWIVIPVLIVAWIGYLFLTLSLPVKEGITHLKGLQQEVKIIYDNTGIPRIYAKSDNDAFFAVGYVHAQNRLWQMEMQRRLGHGRLSEVFGRSYLQTDKLMRTLGLHSVAKKNIQHLDIVAKEGLQSYVDGVNAWINKNAILPIEFYIFGVRPEAWKLEDSLLQAKLMAFNLDTNYRDELTFSLLSKIVGVSKAEELRSGYSLDNALVTEIDKKMSVESISNLLALNEKISSSFRLAGKNAGSNAWVVSGKHTKSGKPLLANDPHLKTQIPSAWFLAEIHGDNLHVTGATVPGLPYVLIGHNEFISWGVTALKADVQDLYLERTHYLDENLYEVDGEWVKMHVQEQWINVRADFPVFLNKPLAPVKWHVRSTRHGPLISDAIGKLETPMALKWTALEEDDTSYLGFLNINYATDWSSFKQSLKNYRAPGLNFVYADTMGNIGYIAGAYIPIRAKGDGSLPVSGWNSEFEWQGYIPQEELPQSFNPPSGYIVTANNKNHGIDYPHFISRDWAPGYRADRIVELLSEKISTEEKITIEDFVAIQGDLKNLQAQSIVSFFTNVPVNTQRQKQAVNYLKNWDLIAGENSIAASIYHMWLKYFSHSILEDKLQVELLHMNRTKEQESLVHFIFPQFLEKLIKGNSDYWCDEIATDIVENCNHFALLSLDRALDDLSIIAGSNMKKWQWGKLHNTHYPHSVFTKINLLDAVFDREIPSGGDAYTVNVANTFFSMENGFRQVAGASYRQVIDLNDWSRSGFINNTGQSGNIISDHYDDFVEPHKNLNLLPMYVNDRQAEGKTLLLKKL